MRWALQPAQVIAAVESLYKDELRPYGRILRKRATERLLAAAGIDDAEADSEDCPNVDVRQLRAACACCPGLRVIQEEGGDWSALLKGRPGFCFVDIYSNSDDYSAEFWDKAARYLETMSGDEMALPGGRYACARALAARELPFLRGLSLGRVCHVVQLALSQKKLLGYFNGAVVPYQRSQSMIKQLCAENQKPFPCKASTASSGLPIASWDTALSILGEILDGTGSAVGSSPTPVPLSNVKRIFRSHFKMELSETALGYSKLSDFLQDPRCTAMCNIKLEGHGYVIEKVTRDPADEQAGAAELPEQPQACSTPQLKYRRAPELFSWSLPVDAISCPFLDSFQGYASTDTGSPSMSLTSSLVATPTRVASPPLDSQEPWKVMPGPEITNWAGFEATYHGGRRPTGWAPGPARTPLSAASPPWLEPKSILPPPPGLELWLEPAFLPDLGILGI